MPINEHLHVYELSVEVDRLSDKCTMLEEQLRDKERKIIKLQNELLKIKCKPAATANGFIKRTDIPQEEWKLLLKEVG